MYIYVCIYMYIYICIYVYKYNIMYVARKTHNISMAGKYQGYHHLVSEINKLGKRGDRHRNNHGELLASYVKVQLQLRPIIMGFESFGYGNDFWIIWEELS